MKTNEPFNVLATNSWSRVPRATVIGNAIFAALGQQALGATVIFQLGAFKLTLATAVGYLVTTAITSWAMKAMAPKPSSFNNQSQGILVNSRSTAAPQDFVYGKVRKGGTVTFYETTGSNNRYLHQIISLAGHEVNDIGDIYINDEVVTVDSDGFVTGDTWKSKIRIYKHLGDQTSASDDFANVTGKNLANTLHTDTSTDSNFVGKGIAYLYVRYEYDRDVFGSGVPLVTAVVEGKKVYDPRNSTTAYSNNAALCLRDFLLSKYGLNDSAIDDTFLQAAANECDETVSLSGSGSESRYTVNGVVRADEPIGSVLEDMTAAMAGTLYWGQGQWKLKAGAYSTPVEDFGLDDLRGPIQLDTRLTMRDNFNKVAGTFIDADSRWITADYPQVLAQTDAGSFATDQVYTITEVGTTDFTSIGAASNAVGVTFTATGAGSGTGKASAFLGEDNGEESILDLPFTFVTSAATAQRLAKLTLLRAREQMTFSATFSMKAFEVEVGDIIRLTNDRYGWTNKTFEVVGWSLFVDGDDGALKVNLTLRETSAAAFDWNAEESAITSNNTTLPSFDAVATVDNLTASNTGFIDGDGNFVPRISLDWADVGSGFHDHFEVHHKLSSESTYQTFNVTESRATLLGYAKDAVVNYRVRAVNQLGVRGEFSPDPVTTITVTGDDTAPSAPTSFTATGVFAGVSLAWTNPSASDLDVIEVYRNTTNSSSTATQVAEVRGDSFTDDGLPVNTTYFYWLKAKDRTGNTSGFSAGQSAVTAYVTESNLDPTYTDSVDTAAVSAAAAQAAQTAAETAETNAETAQTAAETARTAAQTAQTAAETAKAGAETAETNAETAKTAAETAKTAAETAETNAESSATAASTSASNASTSETNAASSATAAAASATTATTKASEASTSATNAATAETNAETAESNAQTYASNASTSATDAATSATNAATSETNAATSATGAASSATTATTKASEASTSAANAATSESNAATSETNAATSESNASTSETNAATSETNAATSATNASNSATTATTKASDAASSATAAAASASTATTKASEASTSASQAATSATNASGSSSSAATSATTAANARKRVQLVDGGVFNAGFELGTNGDAGAPAGWEVGSDHSNAFTVIGHHNSVNSSSPYASELCYGSDTTSAGDWWYIAKYFVAEPSQQFRVNAYVWLGDTHSDANGANAKFVDEDDWIVVARWYDEDGSLLSSSASRSAASYYNNANGTTDAPSQTWFQYISDYLTAPSNTAFVKIEIAAVDANDTVISGNLYDYQTSSAFLGGNAHVRIDDVVFESNNGQILEIQKSALISAESAAAAATSETNAAASETAAASSASSASTSANTATTKASEAATSATSAATSASNASGSASSASTSASDAATSESNAAGSATAASTSASTASTSATNASNSASAAATSATQAATSATSASTSASTATTKASEASTSATSAATSATNADTSAINALRTETRLNRLNQAAGMLAPQIAMKDASYKFAVWEDGTTIYKNGVEMTTIDRGETHTQSSVSVGDRFTSTKPFYGVTVSGSQANMPLASEAMADTNFAYYASRYHTISIRVYPLADGNVTWRYNSSWPAGGSVSGGTTVSLTAGTATSINPGSSNGYVIFESDVPILVSKWGTSGDGDVLHPLSEEVWHRRDTGPEEFGDNHANNTVVSKGGGWYQSSDAETKLHMYAIGDGDGGDSEGQIGYEACGDEYVLPCSSIQEFAIGARDATVVTVKDKNGTVIYTYDMSAYSVQKTGSQSGSGTLNSNGPFYFSGTKPFALEAQIDDLRDEHTIYGFRRDLKPRYGTEAVTEILQSSVTDLEGNQEAAIVMRAKAGTGGAQLELVAGDNVDGGSVSTARIDADNIILDGTVTATQIAAGTITANLIASSAITSAKIAADAITASKIAAGAITANELTTNIRSDIGAGTGNGNSNLSNNNVSINSARVNDFTNSVQNTNINGGKINTGVVTGGNLTVNSTNFEPNAGGGFAIGTSSGTGKMVVGDNTKYMWWDGSELTIQGEIINFRPDGIQGELAGFKSITIPGSYTLTNAFDPGWYVFAMCGGGGGGAGTWNGNNQFYSKSRGGGGGGMAIWTMYMDGNSAVNITVGNQGNGGQNSGNSGGTSNFNYGGTTLANANGGNGGKTSNNSVTGGTAAFNLNPTNNNNVLFRSANTNSSKGASGTVNGESAATGGGGVCVPTIEAYDSNLSAASGSVTGNNQCSAGGTMIGNAAVSGSGNTGGPQQIAPTYTTAGLGAPGFDGGFIGLGGNLYRITQYQTTGGAGSGGLFAGGGGRGGAGTSNGGGGGSGGVGGGGGGAGGRYRRTAGNGGPGGFFWRKL